MHVPNKNSNIQGRSLNVIIDFPCYKELVIKEIIRSLRDTADNLDPDLDYVGAVLL